MILSGPVKLIIGPGGRHSVDHESAAGSASRSRTFTCAHDSASDAVKSVSYFGVACQSPDRSGLPSCVRGAAAEKFGLPSTLRGMPAVGCVNHWAPADDDRRMAATTTNAERTGWIGIVPPPMGSLFR